MLTVSRRLMVRSTRSLWQAAAPAAPEKTWKDKAKAEAIKMLKIQLTLVPICIIVCVFFFPVPTAEQERAMRAEYEKNAGWKT